MSLLEECIATLDPGAYALGVSGGADSIALLRLLSDRRDLQIHIVHLNHETRGKESDGDAAFVATLSGKLKVPCTIAKRSQIEPSMRVLPTNPSARFRAARQFLFAKVVREQNLQGIGLAHHRDDQAETVLHRLLRGGSISGLSGMRSRSRIGGMQYFRPLLAIPRESLREYLKSIGQDWREDASNQSPKYARNRLRMFLSDRPEFSQRLIDLSSACASLTDWTRANAPRLDEEFPAVQIARLPRLVARASVRRWLGQQGIPAEKIDSHAMDKVIEMATDAATAPRAQIAGGVSVHRTGGWISVLGPA